MKDDNSGCSMVSGCLTWLGLIVFIIGIGLDNVAVWLGGFLFLCVFGLIVNIIDKLEKKDRQLEREREDEEVKRLKQVSTENKNKDLFDFFKYDLKSLPYDENTLISSSYNDISGYTVKRYQFDLAEVELGLFDKVEIIQVADNEYNVVFFDSTKDIWYNPNMADFAVYCFQKYGAPQGSSSYFNVFAGALIANLPSENCSIKWDKVWITYNEGYEIVISGLKREIVEGEITDLGTAKGETSSETSIDESIDIEEVKEGPTDSIKFGQIESVAYELYSYIKELSSNEEVITALNEIDELNSIPSNLAYAKGIDTRLGFLSMSDLIKCYRGLCYYDINKSGIKERWGLDIYTIYLISDEKDRKKVTEEIVEKMSESSLKTMYDTLMNIVSKCDLLQEKGFFIVEYLRYKNIDETIINKYLLLLYRFMSMVVKADGTVTDVESSFLRRILSFKDKKSVIKDKIGLGDTAPEEEYVSVKDIKKRSVNQSNEKKKPLDELKELIGLEKVKETVNKLASFVKIQMLRQQKGLKNNQISYHCVFTGNPGTGKTTVARLLAGIYKDLGVLKRGHLVETDRSGLVAEYVGQTAVKTNKIIDSALDGVLFIDEAYSLVSECKEDYGNEAIATLLKRMEDDRDKLVVIIAGYSNEMQTFIDSNPGLQSRFNRYIHFEDYSSKDLADIFKFNLDKYDYILSEDAKQRMTELFDHAVANKGKNFGNARFARNILEKVMENQATRLAEDVDISEEKLRLIISEDFPCIEK